MRRARPVPRHGNSRPAGEGDAWGRFGYADSLDDENFFSQSQSQHGAEASQPPRRREPPARRVLPLDDDLLW